MENQSFPSMKSLSQGIPLLWFCLAILPSCLNAQINLYEDFDDLANPSTMEGWNLTGPGHILPAQSSGDPYYDGKVLRLSVDSSLLRSDSITVVSAAPVIVGFSLKCVKTNGDFINTGLVYCEVIWSTNLIGPWHNAGSFVNAASPYAVPYTFSFTPVPGSGLYVRINFSDGTGLHYSAMIDQLYIRQQGSATCTSTPAAGSAQSNLSAVCPGQQVLLTTSGISTAEQYTWQWQSSPTGNMGSWSDIPGATLPQYLATISQTTYFRYRINCPADDPTNSSDPVQVTLLPPSSCYCSMLPATVGNQDITQVTFNGATNTGSCSSLSTGAGSLLSRYANETASSLTSVQQGAYVPFSIHFNYCNGSNAKLYFVILLDGNQDGDFEDPEELVYARDLFYAYAPLNDFVYIPQSAATGDTRLRLIATDRETYLYQQFDCGYFQYGETEDYRITITPVSACSGTPGPANIVSYTNTICAWRNFPLALDNVPGGINLQYQWQSSSDDSNWSPFGDNMPYALANQAGDTYYRCVITCPNSGLQFTTTSFLMETDCVVMPHQNANYSLTDCDFTFTNAIGGIASASDTVTFYPETGQFIRMEFDEASFNLCSMFIYDSDVADENALIVQLASWNNGVGAVFEATNAAGALTVIFSHGVSAYWDWSAVVSCIPPDCPGIPDPGLSIADRNPVCSGVPFELRTQNYLTGTGLSLLWYTSADSNTWTPTAWTDTLINISQTQDTWYKLVAHCTLSGQTAESVPILVETVNDCINMFTGTVTTCSANFYDSGGFDQAYSPNENHVLTFFPTPGNVIQADFAAFQLYEDDIEAFNGPDVSSPPFFYNISGQTLTSTHVSGALTFRFISNNFSEYQGFSAVISCLPSECNNPLGVFVTTTSEDTVCKNNPFGLGLSPEPAGNGLEFQWQESTDNMNWSDIAGSTGISMIGSQSAGHYYRCRIIRCGVQTAYSDPVWVEVRDCILMTNGSITTCDAYLWDSGGAGGNYGNNQNLTYTFYPDPGMLIHAEFQQLVLSSSDYLFIYDGNTTLNLIAQLTNFSSLSSFTATDTTGALTFRFTSNSSIVNAGWAARITCVPPVCPGQPAPGNTLSPLQYGCPGETVWLSLEYPTTGWGVNYQWQSSTDSLSWSDEAGYQRTYPAVLNDDRYYRCIVTCSSAGLSAVSVPVWLGIVQNAGSVVVSTDSIYVAGCEIDDIHRVYLDLVEFPTQALFSWQRSTAGPDGPFTTFISDISAYEMQIYDYWDNISQTTWYRCTTNYCGNTYYSDTKRVAFATGPLATFVFNGTAIEGQGPLQLGACNPYPALVTVSGLTGTVTAVRLQLCHFYGLPNDANIALEAPNGALFVPMSDIPVSNAIISQSIALKDDAGQEMSMTGAGESIFSGAYLPQAFNYFEGLLPATPYYAPPQGSATFASVFSGIDPNGVWKLYAYDDGTQYFPMNMDYWSLGLETEAMLPLEWLVCKGEAKPEGNRIFWETVAEENVEMFIVERSDSGIDWVEIGRLPASFPTPSTHQYEWLDEPYKSLTYYRIKAIDYGGLYQLSPVISVSRPATGESNFQVFPVPIASQVTLQWENPDTEAVTFSLHDALGNLCWNYQTTVASGSCDLHSDWLSLPAGSYLLTMASARVVQKKWILKR